MSERKKRPKKPDPLRDDFGPGVAEAPDGAETSRPVSGPIPGIACAGDGCVLKPVAELLGKFTLRLSLRGHAPSLSRAAFSGLELMRALRDFLDEEIALAERRKGGDRPRYSKIPVE